MFFDKLPSRKAGAGVNYPFLTQKERDNETGLDYFLARYYSSTQGRFTSVDPQNIVLDKNRGRNADERARILQSYIVQPQNWNRYAYTRNNPLAYTDPNGRCSAPSGLSKGNVGVCIEAFIASPTINRIGRGDNRDFAANDPGKTSRLEVCGTISRGGGLWNVHLTATPGTSETRIGLSRPGTATLAVNANENKDGNLIVNVRTTGDNGFKGWPGAPEGTIQINVTLIVTPDGKVGIESGERTAYPSTGLYVYTMGADGKPAAATLGEGRETTPAALTQPLVPIQPVPPTCNCPKPEDEKTRRHND
jgi:RHS repeat-associated protein